MIQALSNPQLIYFWGFMLFVLGLLWSAWFHGVYHALCEQVQPTWSGYVVVGYKGQRGGVFYQVHLGRA